jgi:predicted alpha/beta-fold hydrolase
MFSYATISGIEPYRPPRLLANGHLQTVYPTLFRRPGGISYRRERMETDDGDFIDLDWSASASPSRRVAIISHGLEGHTRRAYVLGMARALNRAGWDVLAWNQRGCSGEPNRTFRFYHNGVTDDLQRVIDHAKATGRYDEAALVGFSLGGNLTLLHLGQQGERIDPLVSRAVAISVPCDLAASADEIARWQNRLYLKRFLIDLHVKIRWKMERFPELIDDDGYDRIRDFHDFDDRYTAPVHGFRDAADYWARCSCKPHIPRIAVPTLIVNARNDPFLPPSCYPVAEAKANPMVTLLIPERGGHVGFVSFNRQGCYWSEEVALRFLESAP